jgi:hypothetical protein
MTREEVNAIIFTITQSILSLLIVGGSMIFMYQNPDSSATTAIVGLAGAVIAFYFSQAIQNATTNNAIRTAKEHKLP